MKWRLSLVSVWYWPFVLASIGAILAGAVYVLLPSVKVATCESDHARSAVQTYFVNKHDAEQPVRVVNFREVEARSQEDAVIMRLCRATVQRAQETTSVTFTIRRGKPGASMVHVEDPDIVKPPSPNQPD